MARLSPTEIAELAHRAGFRGRDLEIAVAVALAESSGRPGVNAVGAEDSRGLWQIHSVHFGRFDEGWLYEPQYNARAARAVWEESRSLRRDPWEAWSAYTNGAYRTHLAQARQAARRRPSADVGGDLGPSGGDRDSGLRPWRVPGNGAGRTGRVVYSPSFLKRLAGRFTEYLAVVEQVDRRCRHVVDELHLDQLVVAGPLAGEVRRRARDAVEERDGTRRLPGLFTRDVGYLVEHRRRVMGLDVEDAFGRPAIAALIRPLSRDVFRDRSRQRLRRLLGRLGPRHPGRTDRLPTTLGGGRLGEVRLTRAWGGTKSIFEQFVTPFMRRHGLAPGSEKRPYDTVAGSGVSDHYTGSGNAYAIDYPTGSGMDEARALARWMGNPSWRPNSYDSFETTVDGHRFRVQILWGSEIDHGDHVHVGIRRV
jgi:hypothetical protein